MAAYKLSLDPRTLSTHTLLFAVGSTLVHSAACVINDICDRNFDKQVGMCVSLDY
jgi:4-hydroxybenzoate polyprenyltransferase